MGNINILNNSGKSKYDSGASLLIKHLDYAIEKVFFLAFGNVVLFIQNAFMDLLITGVKERRKEEEQTTEKQTTEVRWHFRSKASVKFEQQ